MCPWPGSPVGSQPRGPAKGPQTAQSQRDGERRSPWAQQITDPAERVGKGGLPAYFLEAGGVQLSLVNDLHSDLNMRQKPKITSLTKLNPVNLGLKPLPPSYFHLLLPHPSWHSCVQITLLPGKGEDGCEAVPHYRWGCQRLGGAAMPLPALTSFPVRMCRASFTLAKLPLPMVLRSR